MDTYPNLPTLTILPWPTSLTLQPGYFLLNEQTTIVADASTLALGNFLAELLQPALGFLLAIDDSQQAGKPSISLAIDSTWGHPGNEGYQLTVTPAQVTLRAASTTGIFYALQTLRQLLPSAIFSPTPVAQSWEIPAVHIEDTPRFPWRGCLLDTARHFMPKATVLKLIDLLALHKMNVLHLHLTDDQGWRLEIKKYPRLTEVGSHRRETLIGHAYRPEGFDRTPHFGFYTQEDIREIVAYAAERFITVVPEIDMPGHAQAAIAAYPELGVTDKPVEVATIWGIHPYLFNPFDETLQFLRDVLTEVMELFPSRYIHIGGDEATKQQWQESPEVQARMQELRLKDEEELQSWFLTQIEIFLTQHGRHLVGWDEILEGGLPPEATVMSWQGITGGILAAQANHDVIMTPYTHVYLDSYQSNDPTEPLAIGRYIPLSKVYDYDPIPDVLTPEQAKHILGAQCNLWSEYVNTTRYLEYMLFPRAIALAEITWTPRSAQNFDHFLQRLTHHEERLEHLGVNFWPVARLEQEATFPPRKDFMRD